jgi:hypothetical protein
MAGKIKVASMRPDDMVAAGLQDDFDGTITRARFVIWDYNESDKVTFAAKLTFSIEGEEDFDQFYSAGNLDHWVPSPDGKEIPDFDTDIDDLIGYEGIFAAAVGTQTELNKDSNWAHFVDELDMLGFPPKAYTNSIDCFEGVSGHFNRLPQRERSFAGRDNDDDRVFKILLPTKFNGINNKKSGGSSKVSTKTSKPVSGDEGSLEDMVVEVILEALTEDPMPVKKLGPLMLKNFKGTQKASAVKISRDPDFLESELWLYDSEDETIALA